MPTHNPSHPKASSWASCPPQYAHGPQPAYASHPRRGPTPPPFPSQSVPPPQLVASPAPLHALFSQVAILANHHGQLTKSVQSLRGDTFRFGQTLMAEQKEDRASWRDFQALVEERLAAIEKRLPTDAGTLLNKMEALQSSTDKLIADRSVDAGQDSDGHATDIQCIAQQLGQVKDLLEEQPRFAAALSLVEQQVKDLAALNAQQLTTLAAALAQQRHTVRQENPMAAISEHRLARIETLLQQMVPDRQPSPPPLDLDLVFELRPRTRQQHKDYVNICQDSIDMAQVQKNIEAERSRRGKRHPKRCDANKKKPRASR